MTTSTTASRRVALVAVALVLSTLLGTAGADAGPRQGDGNRVIISGGSSR